jgi:circadian clock protein KaiB
LKLYVAGQTPRSLASFANIRRICEQHIPGRYAIEVIDLLLHPEKAKADQILAVPSLVRHFPMPITKIVGDLGNEERVMAALEIVAVRKGMKNGGLDGGLQLSGGL